MVVDKPSYRQVACLSTCMDTRPVQRKLQGLHQPEERANHHSQSYAVCGVASNYKADLSAISLLDRHRQAKLIDFSMAVMTDDSDTPLPPLPHSLPLSPLFLPPPSQHSYPIMLFHSSKKLLARTYKF
jgi:hypothetical protein